MKDIPFNSRTIEVASSLMKITSRPLTIALTVLVSPSGANTLRAASGLGPSLAAFGVSSTLQDPTLTLRNADGFPMGFDNDWKQYQQAAIQATGPAPSDDRESAALIVLPTDSYTATVSGVNNATGVGVVEIYRLQ